MREFTVLVSVGELMVRVVLLVLVESLVLHIISIIVSLDSGAGIFVDRHYIMQR